MNPSANCGNEKLAAALAPCSGSGGLGAGGSGAAGSGGSGAAEAGGEACDRAASPLSGWKRNPQNDGRRYLKHPIALGKRGFFF